jgi:hypothetical protein
LLLLLFAAATGELLPSQGSSEQYSSKRQPASCINAGWLIPSAVHRL